LSLVTAANPLRRHAAFLITSQIFGGIGLAAALGFRFLDAERRELEPTPQHLPELAMTS
jgi:hypothetical protein